MKKWMTLGAALAAVVVTSWVVSAMAEEKPAFTIKQVMGTCMKGGLCKKVAGGQASDDEKKQLLAMFSALPQNMPPKGDADSWKAKTGALVTAAQAAVDGKQDASKQLQAAANCMACHGAHKGG